MIVLGYSSKTKYILGHGEFKISYATDLFGQINQKKKRKEKGNIIVWCLKICIGHLLLLLVMQRLLKF